MKIKEKDLIEVKNILGRWGEVTTMSQEKSYCDDNGCYIFVTTGLEHGCLEDLIMNGFLVSLYGNLSFSGWIDIKIWKRH